MLRVSGSKSRAAASGGSRNGFRGLSAPGCRRCVPAGGSALDVGPDSRLYNEASGQRHDVRPAPGRRAQAGFLDRACPELVGAPPSRPDPRPGRRRACLFGLLPALALLAGALSPFAATPAGAQTAPPSVPRNVHVGSDDGKLILTWQAPSSWGSWGAAGFASRGYGLSIRVSGTTAWSGPTAHGQSFLHTATSFEFRGTYTDDLTGQPRTITNGTAYDVRISTVTQEGNTAGDLDSHFQYSAWVVVTGVTPQAHSHGLRPGKPVLTATDQTVSSLSFAIPCVSAGSAPVTNYQVEAQKTSDLSVVRHSHTVSSPCRTDTVTVTGLEQGTTYRVRAYARNLFARYSPYSDWVESTTDAMLQGGGTRDPAPTEPLTASFEQVPSEHDGKGTFGFLLRLSETVGNFSKSPRASSFEVTQGRVRSVKQVDAGLWRVRVKPSSWRAVTVTLAGGRDCDDAGAVCTRDGRALTNTASATVGDPVRIRLKGGRAREGRDATLGFAVTLSRAAAETVSVDYETADGTAVAGADYTAASGTLTFAPGETEKTVAVSILDDAIDEGKEKFYLRLSNPQGAHLRKMHSEATGTIRNDDPLQKMWLARFGRTVASDAVAALTARFETPRAAGSHLTVLGQRLPLDGSGDPGSQSGAGRALTDVLTGFARAFGAPTAPAADPQSLGDDPFAIHSRPGGAWNGRAPTVAGARGVTERELLLGTSFRAVLPAGAGSQFTSWGQGASVSRFSAAVPGLGLSGEAATGSLGFDYERGRLLTGFAMTHSVGGGAANDGEWRYRLGSTATTVLPYARLALSERLSAWAMAGTGSGQMTLDLDGPCRSATGRISR